MLWIYRVKIPHHHTHTPQPAQLSFQTDAGYHRENTQNGGFARPGVLKKLASGPWPGPRGPCDFVFNTLHWKCFVGKVKGVKKLAWAI